MIAALDVTVELNIVASALESYRSITGDYPTTEQGLDALVSRPQDLIKPTAWTQIVTEVPLDPWGRRYWYTYGSHEFTLWSEGKDERNDLDDTYYMHTKK